MAEDDVIVRNLVRLMLSQEGYAVLTADDGGGSTGNLRDVQRSHSFDLDRRKHAANGRLGACRKSSETETRNQDSRDVGPNYDDHM